MQNNRTKWKKLGIGLIITSAIFTFLILQTKAAEQSDAIGVRVMPNPNHDSIESWYAKQGFRGSPQSLIVDGYEAIRDGRTVFVNAANLDTVGNKLYTNVYLISYNQESAPKTVDILGQLVSHWKFNNNVVAPGQCSISNKLCQADSDCAKDYICSNSATSPSQGKCVLKDNKQCLIDSDCPISLFCDSLKAKLTRDVKRLGALNQLKDLAESYKVINGTYPGLQAGTYVLGNSISLWPSWQQTLGPQIKLTQPVIDPINILGYCAGYDATTCWNNNTNEFVSPKLVLPYGSYALMYGATSNGVNYNLCAVFESKSAGIDTAEGKFTASSCAVGAGYSGSNSNTAPVLISSYTDGETGKEFNGYVRAQDTEGDQIFWKLTPSSGAWSSWSAAPVLQDAGSNNQKKIYALKTGAPGVYKMLLTLSDSRGAASSTTLTFNVSAANKPVIEADSIDYYVDPINPLKYTFYIQGSNSIPAISNFSFKPLNAGFNQAINSQITGYTPTLTMVGLNRVKVDYSILISPSAKIPVDITLPYRISATVNGATATKDVNLNLKIEQPYLDFECENMARFGKPYQISTTNIPRSCLLGSLKSGNHSLTYSVTSTTSATSLIIRTDATSSNAYLEAPFISGTVGPNAISVKATNEYGASSTKIFNLNINNFCGDGIKQQPNTEGRGGFYNDGNEACDGAAGVITSTISTSSDLQYGCTTNGDSPYPILNNQSCVFKPGDNGGGYCGDGLCQFQIPVNGQPQAMENCWNCQQDCGSCIATITSNADQEHIVYANATRLYKETSATAIDTATTTLIAGKNVFAFWNSNLNDAGYGLAFKINIGPSPMNNNVTVTSFAEFNGSNVGVKCSPAPSLGGVLSAVDYEPASLSAWTTPGFNDSSWLSPALITARALFLGGPYIWDQNTPASGGAVFCRLSFQYDPYSMSMCTRNCSGKTCGPDGCGNICGFCASGQTCAANGTCACTPISCAGRTCGSDGCGGTCGAGACPTNYECSTVSGTCVLKNDCGLRTCGLDSYGNTCGTCNGTCLGGSCIPNSDCATKQCGYDSVTGAPCGTCDPTKVCTSAGQCACAVGTCGATCATCPTGTVCSGTTATDTCICSPTCAGKTCGGDDGCGGKCTVASFGTNSCVTYGFDLGTLTCVNGQVSTAGCSKTPVCKPTTTCATAGMVCGTFVDDCGNSIQCGGCDDNNICTTDACGAGGKCSFTINSNKVSCSSPYGTCSISGQYSCGANGLLGTTCNPLTDPVTTYCAGKACGLDACGNICGPGCASGQTCNGGVCTTAVCTPQCTGKNCGSDGCGGYCGSNGGACTGTNTCSASGVCTAPICTPQCTGKNCGSDGCGGYCGSNGGGCASGQTCNTSGVCVSTCTPSCTGKNCGSDGCGGTCGTNAGSCAAGQTCNTSGVCV
ncbi:MAG: hypothetical protein WCK59_04800, partial [Candidatus Falkowbacteria bacterium]